ncbi:MAG: hypothetical protein ACOVS5_13595, partial [Oligoflexus sp.]
MAGSLKHALGTLYAVNSPYFKDRFNPETKVLESMIYYWMCRYEEARDALADFSVTGTGEALALDYRALARGCEASATTPVFTPKEVKGMRDADSPRTLRAL